MKKDLSEIFFAVEGRKPLPWLNIKSALKPSIKAWEATTGGKLNADQEEALKKFLLCRVMFLAGGPGTGKTTITSIIVEMLKSRGIPVMLLAPTGRAAQRASEVCGIDAKTIHRALNIGKDGATRRGVLSPISRGAVIIDEASMLSRELLNTFLCSLPKEFSVLFIGDPDQLLPVGDTPFLREAIAAQWAPVSSLNKIMRQAEGSAIVRLSRHVRQGNFPAIPDGLPDLEFVPASTPSECIKALFKRVKPKDTILVPQNEGPLGVVRINKIMQKVFNKAEKDYYDNGIYRFKVGDPVMQLQNNYRIHKLGIMNGETGRVVAIQHNMTITVRFGRKVVKFEPKPAEDLALAYAMTVHKSQGSEYERGFLLLCGTNSLMLSRSLIYTAITRFKQKLVCIGQLADFQKAVKNQET